MEEFLELAAEARHYYVVMSGLEGKSRYPLYLFVLNLYLIFDHLKDGNLSRKGKLEGWDPEGSAVPADEPGNAGGVGWG